jgi:arginase
MTRRHSIIEAPSILGLRPGGVDELPRALREAGLHERLGVAAATAVPAPNYDATRHPRTGMLNSEAIAGYSRLPADRVGAALERGDCPLVLGGDCTILLGNLLALARRGRFGLLFFDGHADFYQPDANVNGEAASSELAFATGRGPEILTIFDDRSPLVHDEDVVALGMRDDEEARSYGSQPLPPTIRRYELDAIRRNGAQPAMRSALEHLRDRNVDGVWIHFDADVLDDEIMPAVDYRLAGGLSWMEAETLLTQAWDSGMIAGMDVTIFNPRLDPDGRCASALADFLVRVLTKES